MVNIIGVEPTACLFGVWFFDRLLPPLASGVVIALIASYLLPRMNERYRARREYLLKDVDALRNQLEALLEAAGAYWTAPEHSREAEIEYRLQDISALVESCASDLWSDPKDRGPGLVARLYLECGTEMFWSNDLPSADLDRLRRIATVTGDLAEIAVLSRRKFLVPQTPSKRRPQYKS